jgi:fatty acid desaturase
MPDSPETGVDLPRPAAHTLPAGLLQPASVTTLIRYALADWAVIVFCWLALALAWADRGWLFPVAWLIIAGRFHALGVVLHDACHMRAQQRASRLMPVLELLAGYPIATSLAAMRYHHLRHHRHSGGPEDPYLKLGISHHRGQRNLRRVLGLLLVPAWIVRGFYGSLALAVPALRGSYARWFLQDRSGRDVSGSAEVIRCLRSEPPQALLFVLAIAASVQYPQVILYYFVPLMLAGAINVNRVIVEHVHVACADRRAETILATTVTHDRGAWRRLFLFPRNIGYHQAHHLYPTAALNCLPALHAWLNGVHPNRLANATQKRP